MGKFQKRSFSKNARYFDQSMSITTFYWQADILAESLFDVFDEDKSGALNFYEFMLVKVTPTHLNISFPNPAFKVRLGNLNFT